VPPEDDVAQTPKTPKKKAKKITELAPARLMRSLATPATSRRNKSSVQQDREAEGSQGGDDVNDQATKSAMNGKIGSKTASKETQRSAETRSKAATTEKVKAKASTKVVTRAAAANGTGSKPNKTTPMEPADPIKTAQENSKTFGSQWAVLQESNLTETPGQVDELRSESAGQSKQSQDAGAEGERLFLPSETQQSFPYSQYPEIFASQREDEARVPSHESEDENEVLASVVKVKPPGTYRGLSQIAGSFTAPKFQPVDVGRAKEPESLYGKSRRGVVSETDSSSESDADGTLVASHIPAARRAGLSNK
jgi:hypothetical protein